MLARENIRLHGLPYWYSFGLDIPLDDFKRWVDTYSKDFGIDRHFISHGYDLGSLLHLLMRHSKRFSPERIQYLLYKGANINELTQTGQTAFVIAVKHSYFDRARCLFENGAIVDPMFIKHIKNTDNKSQKRAQYDFVKYLLRQGVRIDEFEDHRNLAFSNEDINRLRHEIIATQEVESKCDSNIDIERLSHRPFIEHSIFATRQIADYEMIHQQALSDEDYVLLSDELEDDFYHIEQDDIQREPASNLG